MPSRTVLIDARRSTRVEQYYLDRMERSRRNARSKGSKVSVILAKKSRPRCKSDRIHHLAEWSRTDIANRSTVFYDADERIVGRRNERRTSDATFHDPCSSVMWYGFRARIGIFRRVFHQVPCMYRNVCGILCRVRKHAQQRGRNAPNPKAR